MYVFVWVVHVMEASSVDVVHSVHFTFFKIILKIMIFILIWHNTENNFWHLFNVLCRTYVGIWNLIYTFLMDAVKQKHIWKYEVYLWVWVSKFYQIH